MNVYLKRIVVPVITKIVVSQTLQLTAHGHIQCCCWEAFMFGTPYQTKPKCIADIVISAIFTVHPPKGAIVSFSFSVVVW